jgi:hypothetical protein
VRVALESAHAYGVRSSYQEVKAMAAATTPFLSIEEYLHTSYEPDADDGLVTLSDMLRASGSVRRAEGILQLQGTSIQLDLAALSAAMQKKKR